MKKFKVRIRAETKVYYDQTVNIDKGEWDALQQAIDSGDHREADRLSKEIADLHLDYGRESDYDNMEGSDVEITEVAN